MNQFVERARTILARELNVDPIRLTPTTRLREDLGMDSIIALNVIFAAERELEITILEGDVVSLQTVRDLEVLIDRLSGTL
jgi:acyl carrier protein